MDVTKCMRTTDGYIWWLENPRLIEPFDVRASASFFYVQDEVTVIPSSEESYRANILPEAHDGEPYEVDYVLAGCFGDKEALFGYFDDEIEEWL